MTIDSFAEYLITHVKTNLPSNCRNITFTVMHHTKPENQPATSICIQSPTYTIAPRLYIDDLYARYLEGMDLPVLVDAFTKWIMQFKLTTDFHTKLVGNFNKAKNYVVSRLIDMRSSHNDEYLEERPVKRLGNTDIGIIYELDLSHFFEKTIFSIPITNSLMEYWGIHSPDIFAMYAAQNTPNLRPPKLSSVSDILGPVVDTDSEINQNESDDMGEYMLVLTNTAESYGANAILYPKVQELLDYIFPDGYYILPSSVHETIIVPKNHLHPQQLLEMVTTINKTDVTVDERLADDVFIVKNGTLVSAI